jgi:crotonobetainyl-CoA:carnitine CoA-transferase CaiB-like acyl-CoA transferase
LPPRSQWGTVERRAISGRIRVHETAALLGALAEADVWAERCVEDGWTALYADEVARQKQLVVEVDDPRYGRIVGCLGPLVNFSRSASAPEIIRSAPSLGQHSEELLIELGYPIEDIERLRERRVIA